jgi:hypothetical protein
LPVLVLVVIALAVVFAPVSAVLAHQRGRFWLLWFLFGVILGPVAAGLLVMAPPGRCPACGTRARGWPIRCRACGLHFATGTTAAEAVADAAAEGAAGMSSGAAPTTTARRSSARETKTTRATGGRGGGRGKSADVTAAGEAPFSRPATALGLRVSTIRGTNAPPKRTTGTLAILGSGIYMGGSEPLQIGSRYFLARVGSEMQALGPMHVSPSAVAARVPLADTQTTVVADRLLLTGRTNGRGPTLAFSAIEAEPGVDFQEQLRSRARRKATSS